MRIVPFTRIARPGASQAAFTLTEIMVTMGIFMIVIAGVLLSHLTGMKFFNLTASKLSATDGARKLIGDLITEVRSCKDIQVGEGNASTFTEAADGSPQAGRALQIYPVANNTNLYIRYFLDTDQKLKRVTSISSLQRPLVVAEYITNQTVFISEHFDGTVLTERENNRVIHVQLQFCQIQYPVTAVGKGGLYDFYQINTRITRRVLE